MENYVFAVFILLCFTLLLAIFRDERYVVSSRVARTLITLFSLAFFSFWFVKRSISGREKDSFSLQILNTLPQALDFYVVQVGKGEYKDKKSFGLKHLGNIRPEHYRLHNIPGKDLNQFWVVGFLGRKNPVYFSQHAIPKKAKDQIIEVHNYTNQSTALSELTKKMVNDQRLVNIRTGIWISLSFLLIFFNIVTLLRRK